MTAVTLDRPPIDASTLVGPREDWYVESTALVKRVIDEPGSTAMTRWLDGLLDAGGSAFTSDLGRTEAYRVVARNDPHALPGARAIIDSFLRVRVVEQTYVLAMELEPAVLRTLDALHLAVVLGLDGRCAGIVTYDRRIVEAAGTVGIRTISP
jgi:predicted nucleic acid-binding protein